jgi:hypothetical protein
MSVAKEQTIDGVTYVTAQAQASGTCRGCAANNPASPNEVTALCRKLGDCWSSIFIVKPQPKEQPMSAVIEADRTSQIKTAACIDASALYREHRAKNFNIPMVPRMEGFRHGFDAGFDAGVLAERTRLQGVQYQASTETAPVIERKAGKLNDLIVTSLRTAGPATADDLSKRLGVPLNSISPRFATLKRLGLAHVASGVRGKSIYAYGSAPL